jgi:eukaryotic-like serine/threonine-protein kinase
MAKQKVDSFLDLVRRSELVERDQLNRVLVQLKDEAAGKPIDDTEFVAARLVELELLTRWQADRLLEGRHKGFFLGKYKLLRLLGQGGMSHVYLAEHLLMHRRVAIKVLPKHRVNDSSYLARFRREAQAIAALDHRNIVRAYDIDNVDDVHYQVMEYVEGRDLQAIVKEDGVLDYPRAAEYIRQAAEGLEHAHRAGLIHRDVKPANLLVDQHNVVKVLDLGLARFTDEERASLTVKYDENVLGTADYLAPEQAIDSHGADARADIYSLGCSFYYLLSGHPPFPDGTLPQRLMMHQKSPPPDVRLKRPDAPEDLLEICTRMMAKRPSARYQSAQEVADALGDWLRARGHNVDSGVGSGSFGRQVHPGSSTRLKAVSAHEIDSSTARKMSSGVRSSLLAATGDSGVIGAAVQAKGASPAPAASQPVASPPAAKGGSGVSGRKAPRSEPPRNPPAKAALPVARPLMEADPLAEILGEISAPGGLPATPLGATQHAHPADAESGQLYGRYVSSVGSAAKREPGYRGRSSGAPAWLWPLIIGGCLLAVLLVILGVLYAL